MLYLYNQFEFCCIECSKKNAFGYLLFHVIVSNQLVAQHHSDNLLIGFKHTFAG